MLLNTITNPYRITRLPVACRIYWMANSYRHYVAVALALDANLSLATCSDTLEAHKRSSQ